MKKILLVVLILSVFLVGCSRSTEPSPEEQAMQSIFDAIREFDWTEVDLEAFNNALSAGMPVELNIIEDFGFVVGSDMVALGMTYDIFRQLGFEPMGENLPGTIAGYGSHLYLGYKHIDTGETIYISVENWKSESVRLEEGIITNISTTKVGGSTSVRAVGGLMLGDTAEELQKVFSSVGNLERTVMAETIVHYTYSLHLIIDGVGIVVTFNAFVDENDVIDSFVLTLGRE
jgi:hypothetical protein